MQRDHHSEIRVLLVDDHAIVRCGVRALFEDESDILVVGEAGSGEEALEKVATLSPDLVVMDINMPGIGGLEATRRLKGQFPSVSVIMLTVNDAELFLIESIRAGAASYLLKDSSSKQLVHSVRAVAAGTSLIPLHLLQKAMLSEKKIGVPPPSLEGQLLEPLSLKEMEVLERIVKGMKNLEIAEDLSLATVTVKKRVQSILAKMLVSDRTQAALKAVKLKLVDF